MAADHQLRRPGGLGMDGAMDESTYPSTPFSAAQAQQLQFQQQLQLQTQPMESHLGPAASSLMQVHRGDSGAGMSMTNTLLQPMTDGFESTASMQQQNVGSSAVVTPVDQEPAMPQLYKTNKMRRPELWQFIRLVVPDPPHIAAGKTYTNQDAKQAYCMKCKRSMHYNTGSSNNVSRHMAKFHAADLASYAQKLADQKMRNKKQQAKSGNATAERSVSGSPNTGVKRKRSPIADAMAYATMEVPDNGLDQAHIGDLQSTSEETQRRARSGQHIDGKDGSLHGDLTQEETEQLNTLVARWVAKHYHPFGITEDPELKELLHFAARLRKPITLPAPTSVRASVQSLSARTRMDLLRQISSEALFFSMTSEVWITAERDVFVSFTIHYLTEAFERRHFTMDVREHNGRYFTYEAKQEILNLLLSRWNLDSRYLSLMLWQSQPRIDNRTNSLTRPFTQQVESAAHGFEMILAPLLHGPREVEADGMQVFFFDELVNNAVACVPSEYQEGVEFVREQVSFFRELAFFLTNHPRAVRRICKLTAGSSQIRLVTDTKVSWISTLDMLKRLVKKRDVIRDFFTYVETSEGHAEFQDVKSSSTSSATEADGVHRRAPTNEQWCAIECLLQVLQPFENVALAIGKEKFAASSLTFPLLKFLKRDLEKLSNFQRVFAKYWGSQSVGDAEGGNLGQPFNESPTSSQHISNRLENVRNYLYTQFNAHFSRPCNDLMWISQLDPRFVRMKYLSDSERETCKARLIDQCFALANFTQLMANQRNKVASSLPASGANTITAGVSSGLDPTSTSFLDFQPNRYDQDTNNFLRELLFEDTQDDPALAYQQQQQNRLAGSFVPGQVSTGPSSTSASDASTSIFIEQETELRMRVADEVKAYYEAVASAKVTAMRDPLKWWRDNTATFPLLMPLARQWLGSVGSVRPSGIVQIGTGALDTTATNSNGQGMHHNATTGTALPPGNFAVHSEPELVRDLVFVHNNC